MTYPYVAGAVLLASDLNTDFAAKSDYAPSQNTQTGTGASAYTFVLADASRLTVANAATAGTYTIPPAASVTWVANTIINVASIGAGTITFAAGAGVTVTNTAGTLSQYQSAMLVRTALNAWTVVPFAGGASLLTSSDVSATTGSPTITTTGSFTVYKFTASGSITFGKAGICDMLVIGGGAGARLGGGGAGGVNDAPSQYVPSGVMTIVIGAGGAANTGGSQTIAVPILAPGGGSGGTNSGQFNGENGASGGGGGNTVSSGGAGLARLGNAGGAGLAGPAAGGGGAGAAGASGAGTTGGAGGVGISNSITGTPVLYGGGGGGYATVTGGAGGATGGSAGSASTGTAGTVNTGGGGGGGGAAGGAGGSGCVYIKVRT